MAEQLLEGTQKRGLQGHSNTTVKPTGESTKPEHVVGTSNNPTRESNGCNSQGYRERRKPNAERKYQSRYRNTHHTPSQYHYGSRYWSGGRSWRQRGGRKKEPEGERREREGGRSGEGKDSSVGSEQGGYLKPGGESDRSRTREDVVVGASTGNQATIGNQDRSRGRDKGGGEGSASTVNTQGMKRAYSDPSVDQGQEVERSKVDSRGQRTKDTNSSSTKDDLELSERRRETERGVSRRPPLESERELSMRPPQEGERESSERRRPPRESERPPQENERELSERRRPPRESEKESTKSGRRRRNYNMYEKGVARRDYRDRYDRWEDDRGRERWEKGGGRESLERGGGRGGGRRHKGDARNWYGERSPKPPRNRARDYDKPQEVMLLTRDGKSKRVVVPSRVDSRNTKESKTRIEETAEASGKLHPEEKDQSGTDTKSDRSSKIDFQALKQKSRHDPRGNSDREWRQKPKPRGTRIVPTVQSDELAQQLMGGAYECMVCCESVRGHDQVWNCGNCYHVFHLRCIKKWATSPAAAVNEESPTEGWRCPGCQNPSTVVPSVYKCYCGKVTNPRPKSRGELTVHHSCGELCLKKLALTSNLSCRHQCHLLCHPGPCPPCPVMVTRECPCGKKTYTIRCSRSSDLPSCGSVCGKRLACGKHQCQGLCHSGDCPSCDVLLSQQCYCGQRGREVQCGETDQESFSCEHTCNREMDCGNHLCEQPCHKGECLSCPLLPAHVTTCPCGATPLSELLPEGTTRISCLDPVPTCANPCGKLLPCSTDATPHLCESPCHDGECPPCNKTTDVWCRCGREVMIVPCVEVKGKGDRQCRNVCNKKKTCGRHRCNTRCCVDEDHICEMVCGRRLQCGNHYCQERCHSTSRRCDQCWEYSYEELTCHCGAEVILPPIPCGTHPPPCSLTCARMHPCSHPVLHTCHSDEECPPCTFLTEKRCMGGHEVRRNIPCHITDVSCGNPCGKPLPCTMHKCQRICHKGVCLQKAEDCKQPCTVRRKYCDHECSNACHQGQPCPDNPCRARITVQCRCGRKTENAVCLASGSGDVHQAFQKLMSVDLGTKIRQLQSGQSVSISSVTVTGTSLAKERYLDCDEVCAQEERNRKLASALEIENPIISPLGNPSPQYSPFLIEQARKDSQFITSVEEGLKTLVENMQKSPSAVQTRSHSFPTMKNSHRRVIHELAVHYGCETTSYDAEPQRNVVATVKRSRAMLPSLTLTKLVERERYHRPPPAPVPIMAVSERTETDEGTGSRHLDYFSDDLNI